jgi:hypothetical protein
MAVAFQDAADRTGLSDGHRRVEANVLDPSTALQPPSRILLESQAQQVAPSSGSKRHRNCHGPFLTRRTFPLPKRSDGRFIKGPVSCRLNKLDICYVSLGIKI